MADTNENIKWKFQIWHNLTNTAIDQYGHEYDRVRYNRDRYERFMIRIRNEILSGIGFLISILVALVTLEVLTKYYIFYVIIIAFIALAIFTAINEILYRKIGKYNKFSKEYVKIIFDEIAALQGNVASMAILETISEEQIIALTEFLSLLTLAQSYTLQTAGYKMLNTEKVNHEEYRQYYMVAKSSIENYRKSNLPYVISRIEKFIMDFEENEKSSHQTP